MAYALDGALLGSDDGMARIIAPGDKSGARNVTKIMRITVLDRTLREHTGFANPIDFGGDLLDHQDVLLMQFPDRVLSRLAGAMLSWYERSAAPGLRGGHAG